MTKNEFRQHLVLHYLKNWVESIEDSTEVCVYGEDGDMGLSMDAKDVVMDAYDVATCIASYLEKKEDGRFFDKRP